MLHTTTPKPCTLFFFPRFTHKILFCEEIRNFLLIILLDINNGPHYRFHIKLKAYLGSILPSKIGGKCFVQNMSFLRLAAKGCMQSVAVYSHVYHVYNVYLSEISVACTH